MIAARMDLRGRVEESDDAVLAEFLYPFALIDRADT
jgi:hypothetical protein